MRVVRINTAAASATQKENAFYGTSNKKRQEWQRRSIIIIISRSLLKELNKKVEEKPLSTSLTSRARTANVKKTRKGANVCKFLYLPRIVSYAAPSDGTRGLKKIESKLPKPGDRQHKCSEWDSWEQEKMNKKGRSGRALSFLLDVCAFRRCVCWCFLTKESYKNRLITFL